MKLYRSVSSLLWVIIQASLSITVLLWVYIIISHSGSGLQVEGEQIVTEADGEDAVVEDDVVEELPKEAETIPRHATGRLVHIPGTRY